VWWATAESVQYYSGDRFLSNANVTSQARQRTHNCNSRRHYLHSFMLRFRVYQTGKRCQLTVLFSDSVGLRQKSANVFPLISLSFSTNVSKGINNNSVALVRERTMLTERPPLVGEVSLNFCGWRGVERRRGFLFHLISLTFRKVLCYE
jgi:hypothetical protein